jgi:hypothetical protein
MPNADTTHALNVKNDLFVGYISVGIASSQLYIDPMSVVC